MWDTVAAVCVIAVAYLFMYADRIPSDKWLLGFVGAPLTVLTMFSWLAWSVRCPKCQMKWVLELLQTRLILNIGALERCPRCGFH